MWKQLQAAIILTMASCVMHMKGAVACRDRPSPGFYVCLSASECFPARGEDSVLLNTKVAVVELLSCTLCSNSEGRSARSEFHCKDAKCNEGGHHTPAWMGTLNTVLSLAMSGLKNFHMTDSALNQRPQQSGSGLPEVVAC